MHQLTAKERLIWRELRDRARAGSLTNPEGSCISYGDLGELIDPEGQWHNHPVSRPPFRGLNIALGHVSHYEHERGRPLLSSLVVTKYDGQPGPGFAAEFGGLRSGQVEDPTTFWHDELIRTVAFWSARDDVLLFDAAMDRVLGELAAIRQLLTER